ncbi:hypothetical protein ACFX1R_026170 [Malus domestica]
MHPNNHFFPSYITTKCNIPSPTLVVTFPGKAIFSPQLDPLRGHPIFLSFSALSHANNGLVDDPSHRLPHRDLLPDLQEEEDGGLSSTVFAHPINHPWSHLF